MKDPKIVERLNAALIRVLEQTAFLFADSINDLDDVALRTTEFIQVSLDFSGSRCGQVHLVLPVKLCDEVCVNMLGIRDRASLTEESKIDAAKELANIVVGQVLTDIYGTSEVFSQTPPEVQVISMEEILGLIEHGSCAFSVVDEAPVVLIHTDVERDHEHQSTNC